MISLHSNSKSVYWREAANEAVGGLVIAFLL